MLIFLSFLIGYVCGMAILSALEKKTPFVGAAAVTTIIMWLIYMNSIGVK